jgi:CTP:molybdopterin cytidylyltransferase MocA
MHRHPPEPAGREPGMRAPRWIGVIPDTSGRSSIGGAPLPLLQGENETFLEGAIRRLKEVGADRILVGTPEGRGPVAALALRCGAEPAPLAPHPLVDPADPLLHALHRESPIFGILVLPASFPRVRTETLQAIRDHAETRGGVGDGLAVRASVNGVGGFPLALAGGWDALGPEAIAEPSLFPVDDPGAVLEVATLPVYRRHFPQSFRKRFQKW